MNMKHDNDRLIDSPCIGICSLNENKICIGCYRRIDEIANWLTLTEEERQQIKLRAEKDLFED